MCRSIFGPQNFDLKRKVLGRSLGQHSDLKRVHGHFGFRIVIDDGKGHIKDAPVRKVILWTDHVARVFPGDKRGCESEIWLIEYCMVFNIWIRIGCET